MALTKISRSLLDTGISDSSDATAITIDSSENVTIGVTNPVQISTNLMHGTSGQNGFYVRTAVSSAANPTFSNIDDTNTGAFFPAADTLGFSTGGLERARINSSGQIGIGTSSPVAKLTVQDDSVLTVLATTDTSTNAYYVSIGGSTSDTAGVITAGSGSAGNSVPLIFRTASSGTEAEKMRIEAGGRIVAAGGFCAESGITVIGQSERTHFQAIDSEASSAPRWRPSVDNIADLGDASLRWDDVRATNGTIVTSDRNEKNTITDSDLGLDFVKRLSPKSYKFNGKTRTHYGLIAQDIETVLSDISKSTTDFAGFCKDDISEEQDGSELRYGLRYTEFVSPLIKAIQEQQDIIEDLKARIETLEGGE